MIYINGTKKLIAKFKGNKAISKIYKGTRVVWSGLNFNKWSYKFTWSYKNSWKYK